MKYKRFSYRMPFHLSYPYFEGRNLEVKGELGFVYLHLASSGEERMTKSASSGHALSYSRFNPAAAQQPCGN